MKLFFRDGEDAVGASAGIFLIFDVLQQFLRLILWKAKDLISVLATIPLLPRQRLQYCSRGLA